MEDKIFFDKFIIWVLFFYNFGVGIFEVFVVFLLLVDRGRK